MAHLFNKEDFLVSTNGGFDFYIFVIPELEKTDDTRCKSVLNPFYEDTNAALSIYFDSEKGKWLFYDHGSPPNLMEYKGDVFDFAGHYYKLDPKKNFRELMEKMASDLKVELKTELVEDVPQLDKFPDSLWNEVPDPDSIFQMEYWRDPDDYMAWMFGFELFYRGQDKGIEEAYTYFKQFGITMEVLKQYGVAAIDRYKFSDSELNIKTRIIPKDQLVIGYQNLDFVKFYKPDPKSFWFVGTKSKDYVFGWNQIHRRIWKTDVYQTTLIITGGEKDVLSLTSLGYDAVCFNSETATVPKEAKENLLPLFRRIVILYDLDETGTRQAKVIASKLQGFNVSICTLPATLKERGGKDVSDYMRLGMLVNDLRELIENAAPFISESVNPEQENTDIEAQEDEKKLEESFSDTPLLPEEVYDLLPQTLKQICSSFKDKRDRDVALLSSITVLSSCFPTIRGMYGGHEVGCNINLFISAPASAGKGVMSWSRNLGKSVAKHLKEKYEHEYRKFRFAQEDYNKNKGNQEMEPPVEPKEQKLFIPANSATSTIIELLDHNQRFGIIFDNEGDTLASTLKNDWADFSSVIRKAFHHEPVTMARRANKEFREVEKPHLSLLLSGTRNQVANLIGTVENGQFSRYLFYDFDSELVWKDQFGSGDNAMEKLFQQHGETVLQYWKKGEQTGNAVFLIKEQQKDNINKYFEKRLKELYKMHGEDIIGNVKRTCLTYYRIAMLLTAIGLYDCMNLKVNKMPETGTVEDKYSRAAFLVVDTLLTHLEIVFTRLQHTAAISKLNAMQKKLYEGLPKEFNWSEFLAIAAELGIGLSTAQKYRRDLKKHRLIINPMPDVYRKV